MDNTFQRNEVGGSCRMELEGLKRCREILKDCQIRGFVSDRHSQVVKWVREEWKVPQFFDCWHIVKGKMHMNMTQ